MFTLLNNYARSLTNKSSVLFFLLFPVLLFSQTNEENNSNQYIVNHRFFSVENSGLASRYITDATLDSRGFMWFATFGGISRFDGNSFFSITKKQGLKSNTVFRVAADKNAHLFVISQDLSSENNVLNYAQVFDLYSNSFIPISKVLPKIPFSEKLIKDIHCDSLGATYILKSNPLQLWKCNTNGGFQLLNNLTKWEEEIRKRPEFINYLQIKFIASGDQVFISNINFNTAYYLTNKNIIPINSHNNQPVQICSNHELRYLNVGEGGYHRVDAKGNDTFIASASTNKLLNDKGISIYKSNANSLNSLLIKDSQSNIKFILNNSTIDLSNIEGLANDKEKAIVKFIQTAENQFWILTNLGVYQLVLSKKYFSNYFNISRSSVYPGTPMRGIYADSSLTYKVPNSDDLLIASSWDRLLIQQGENETEIPVVGMPYAVLKHKSNIYYGTNSLWQLDLQTKTSIKLDSLSSDELITIFPLNDSLLIIGRRTGIFVYNIHSRKTYLSDKGYPNPLFLTRILRTKTHGILAVAENGLYVLNESGYVIDFYGPQVSQRSHRLPYSGIRDICEDSQGIFWLGLKEGGLVRWNWNGIDPLGVKQFKQFGFYEGFPSENICRIEADKFGFLWISTFNGLVRFKLSDYTTRIFTTKDGLTHNEFNWSSSFQSADGILYFGGLEGVNAFDPKEFYQKELKIDFPFQLTRFTKFSEKANSTIDCLPLLRNASTIIMDVGDTYINIGFSLLDFIDRTHRFAYKIEGIDKEWHNIEQNSLLLSGLPYGNHTIRIKAQLENGQWNPTEIILPIRVLKPFYLKAWFFIVCALLLSAALITYFRMKQKRLLKNKQMLESTVYNRTISLKNVIEQRELLIKEIHHRVRNNLQTISGLLQLQKGTLKDEQLLAVLNEGQSRINSIALIHQSLYQTDDLVSIDFKPFLSELSNKISELFDSYKREFVLSIEMEDIHFDVETSIPLGLILNELLTNSLKYAFDENGLVHVSIVIREISPFNFELIYSDNGPGLSEHINLIKPSTLGLRLIKGLAGQLKGKIDYTFQDKSTFRISFKSK
jgi:two-component sensor histidine kinase/ligand-binding sensor domain-containing protein